MFTGIVTQVGTLKRIERFEASARLTIEGSFDDVQVGDSVAVAGVCLTATETTPASIAVDVVPETLRRTRLGDLDVGSKVNLELALRADSFVGGHFVQGHVDAVAEVIEKIERGGEIRLRVSLPAALAPYVVEKGSVALDGVSLTVASVGPSTFDVALIPHTLAQTTLADASVGSRLNVEVDMLAKYVERQLAGWIGDRPQHMETE